MGNDLSVVRSARVSYDAAWRAGENKGSDKKLIKYLWKNKHTTPFESVQFTFEVKAPIFVFRQWHRHRTWSYNELSGRYKELAQEFFIPNLNTIGTPSVNNKQGRIISNNKTPEQMELLQEIEEIYTKIYEQYQKLLKKGWPRELARTILPLGTYSHMFASCNLLNLFKFIQLRDHDHAQYEIRAYARAMKELVTPIVPVCMEAFDENR
jgi:thymidylate synthase (FAD)